MKLIKLINIIPAAYPEKKRKLVEKMLSDLDESILRLKHDCYMLKINYNIFKENRCRLLSKLKNMYPNSMVLLKGQEFIETPCSNTCFEQDAFFFWAFGLQNPNLWGAIDIETATSYIIYEPHESGHSFTNPIRFKKKYKIDRVMSSEEFQNEISRLGHNMFLVLSNMDKETLEALNFNRVVRALAKCDIWVCNSVLTPVMNSYRVIKSPKEQEIMAICAKLNSKALTFVLHKVSPGMAGYTVGALFRLYIKSFGSHIYKARPLSCLTGRSVYCMDEERSPFYLQNRIRPGDLCILNMGVVLHGYRTNLIATIPASGTFSHPQAVIYNIVLEIRAAMLKELKPGISFLEVSNTAHKKMIDQLRLNFILEGTTDDIMESGLCDVFNPNGIGHFLGIDFYDCEGPTTIDPKSNVRENFKNSVAEEGMILALNSEVYLNTIIINNLMDTPARAFLQSKYLPNYLGQVARIQDVILISSNSQTLLSNLPRTIASIERTMSQNIETPLEIDENHTYKNKKTINKEANVPQVQKLSIKRKVNDSKRQDLLAKLLDEIQRKLERKPMKLLNEIMEKVYTSPYKIRNMLEHIMIPSVLERKRPALIPYPKASRVINVKIKLPKEGFGCRFPKWTEQIEDCYKMTDKCLDTEGIDSVIFPPEAK